MATVTKNFRIKSGLIVEGATGTINGQNILTETGGNAYILNLVGGATLVKSVDAGTFAVDGAGNLTVKPNTFDAYGSASSAQSAAISAASSDATTKASAAQSAAITAAATDATTKVAAEAALRVSGDAASVATAAADATTKANAAQAAAEATAAAANTAQQNGTTAFTALNVNDQAKQFAASSSGTAAVAGTAYEWAKSDYRSAKVLVKIDNATHNEVSEVLITLDASDNVAITEYAIVGTNGSRGTITADVSGSNVRIRVTPVDNSTVKVSGTLLK
jgi:hypothetical protein